MPSPEQQIKEGFDKLKSTFEDYKNENNERLEKLEKSRGTADKDEILAKMDADIEKFEKRMEEKLDELKAAANRSGSNHDDEKKEAEEKKAAYKSAIVNYMRKGEQRLTAEEMKLLEEVKEEKALSRSSDPDGGYTVREEVAAEMSKRIYETSKMRQLASVQTISSDCYEVFADWDEPGSGWESEQSSQSETDSAKLNKIKIPVHVLRAEPKATQQILEDSAIDIEAWHQERVSKKFARDEETAFFTGNGVDRPKGILSYDSTTTNEFNKVEQFTAVASGSGALDDADDLIDLQGKLFEEFQANAKWLMKRTTAAAVRKLQDGQGMYLWNYNTVGTLNEIGPVLLDKPVVFSNDMAAVAADALAVAYGDFAMGYQIVDRVGISVLRDPYTAKPFVKFYTRKRVGGGVKQFQAIKILKLKS